VTKSSLYIPTRSDKLGLQVEVRETLLDVRSAFQRIQIVDTLALGRVLLLDGHVQLAEIDEHAYHESLVHIPLCSVPSPRRALVVGGGDGGVLRELCRHASLEHIDMVEIDADVVEACRAHMPFVSGGAFDDPRVRLHIEDAFVFVKRGQDAYDLIVVDATDTYEEEEGELSEGLFTQAFYEDLRRLLSDKGFVVSQADNLVYCPYSTEAALARLDRTFSSSGTYWCVVPSFGGFSGFVWGSEGAALNDGLRDAPPGLRYLDETTYALALKQVPFQSCF
jgi:spermidine synthase